MKRSWVQILFVALALVLWSVIAASAADTTALQLRQLNSHVKDGVTPDTPVYFQLIGVIDESGLAQSLTIGVERQSGVPGTTVVLLVDSTSSCSSALGLGEYRITPVANGSSVANCCRSGTSCTAVLTQDTPYVDGQYYLESVTSATANDVICCIDTMGTDTLTLYITPITP